MSDETKSVPTFFAWIYVGFRVGRTTDANAPVHTIEEIREVCRAYCDEVGLCVTVEALDFIYTRGGEPGARVGLINYPRFPSNEATIRAHAIELAARLKARAEQMAVSVVFPDVTIILAAGSRTP